MLDATTPILAVTSYTGPEEYQSAMSGNTIPQNSSNGDFVCSSKRATLEVFFVLNWEKIEMNIMTICIIRIPPM